MNSRNGVSSALLGEYEKPNANLPNVANRLSLILSITHDSSPTCFARSVNAASESKVDDIAAQKAEKFPLAMVASKIVCKTIHLKLKTSCNSLHAK
jgi:hypothetical protein